MTDFNLDNRTTYMVGSLPDQRQKHNAIYVGEVDTSISVKPQMFCLHPRRGWQGKCKIVNGRLTFEGKRDISRISVSPARSRRRRSQPGSGRTNGETERWIAHELHTARLFSNVLGIHHIEGLLHLVEVVVGSKKNSLTLRTRSMAVAIHSRWRYRFDNLSESQSLDARERGSWSGNSKS